MWNKLSMADKAKYILLAVLNGVTNLDDIRDTYNSYTKGGKVNYKRREDIEESVREEYPYLYDKYPVKIIEDDNFDSGYGNIEAMLGEDAQYDNGYYYENPYPNENTLIFNNKVRNPETAAKLDYLHVLRKEDPYYQELLSELHDAAIINKGNDVMQTAISRYNEDKSRGKVSMPFSRYVENEEDGWLRNMFHTGTAKEMEEDNYYPDKTQMMKWNPDLINPTKQIYSYLYPTQLPELTVTPKRFCKGGGIFQNYSEPIQEYKPPKNDDNLAINFLSNWLNNRRKQLYNNINDTKAYTLNVITGEWASPNALFPQASIFKGITPARSLTNKNFYTLIENASNTKRVPDNYIGGFGQYNPNTKEVTISPKNSFNTENTTTYNGTRIHEFTHALRANPQEATIQKILKNNTYLWEKDKNGGRDPRYPNREYYYMPTEVYSRLMEYRYLNNLKPKLIIDKKYLDSHREQLLNRDLDILDDNTLIRLFNEVAANDIDKTQPVTTFYT